jgi:hypothetical protein
MSQSHAATNAVATAYPVARYKHLLRAVKEQADALEAELNELVSQSEADEREWLQRPDAARLYPEDKRYVVLDVGGELFRTSIQTLSSSPSVLQTLFSRKYNVQLDQDGYVFFDRNPRMVRSQR